MSELIDAAEQHDIEEVETLLNNGADIDFQNENGWTALMKASLKGWKVEHIAIPTIYGAEGSAIKNIKDTVKFVSLWFKSFIWT